MKNLFTINRILLGLLMLVAGMLKIFVTGPDAVEGMLSKIVLFSWAPMFWAWVLIVGEIFGGLSVLANFKLKYTAFIPAFILVIAILTVNIKWAVIGTTNLGSLILNLIVLNGYLILAWQGWKK